MESGQNAAITARKHKPSKLELWSAAVKARDGRCLDCGATDDLHAHHIEPKAKRPDLMLDVSNGKTLCYRCHKATHERDRVRYRASGRPQRRTLEKRIEALEAEVADLREKNKRLGRYVNECNRGSCETKLNALRKA